MAIESRKVMVSTGAKQGRQVEEAPAVRLDQDEPQEPESRVSQTLTDDLMETLLHAVRERAEVERRHADYLRTADARIQAILDLIGRR